VHHHAAGTTPATAAAAASDASQQEQLLRVTTVHNDGCVHTWARGGARGTAWALAGSSERAGRPALPVGCGVVLPDGQLLALGCERGALLLLAPAAAAEVAHLRHPPPPGAGGAALGPVVVVDELRGGHAPFATVRALAVAAGGRALLSADDAGVIAVWAVPMAVPVATVHEAPPGQ
jgi:hypothetical protein